MNAEEEKILEVLSKHCPDIKVPQREMSELVDGVKAYKDQELKECIKKIEKGKIPSDDYIERESNRRYNQGLGNSIEIIKKRITNG